MLHRFLCHIRLGFAFSITASIFLFAQSGCGQPDETVNKTERKSVGGSATVITKAEEGESKAKGDIKAGILRIRTMPLPSPPWAGRYFQLAKDNGIELKSTTTVEQFHSDSVQAYNRVMNAEIERKFGPGFLQKLEQQAQK